MIKPHLWEAWGSVVGLFQRFVLTDDLTRPFPEGQRNVGTHAYIVFDNLDRYRARRCRSTTGVHAYTVPYCLTEVGVVPQKPTCVPQAVITVQGSLGTPPFTERELMPMFRSMVLPS